MTCIYKAVDVMFNTAMLLLCAHNYKIHELGPEEYREQLHKYITEDEESLAQYLTALRRQRVEQKPRCQSQTREGSCGAREVAPTQRYQRAGGH